MAPNYDGTWGGPRERLIAARRRKPLWRRIARNVGAAIGMAGAITFILGFIASLGAAMALPVAALVFVVGIIFGWW